MFKSGVKEASAYSKGIKKDGVAAILGVARKKEKGDSDIIKNRK